MKVSNEDDNISYILSPINVFSTFKNILSTFFSFEQIFDERCWDFSFVEIKLLLFVLPVQAKDETLL
jgi:hypothetical protein